MIGSEVMNILKSVVLKIAKLLGLSLTEKSDTDEKYDDIFDISFTASIAQRVSTLTLMDSSISIKGNNSRAEYLNKLFNTLINDKIDTAAEVALGTGDVLLKPYSDGDRIGIDIIKNDDFYICDSCGDFIKSIIVKCETIKKSGGNVFERYEAQRVKQYTDENGNITSALYINNYAFKNGTQIPLTDVTEWVNIEPEIVILNTDRLLVGRIKNNATTNRLNINSPNGVPITYGLEKVMKNSVESYNIFNRELSAKEAFIFADKTLFKKDKETGKPIIPRGKERLFMSVPAMYGENQSADSLIKEYSPDIRSTELMDGIEQNLKFLEMLAGLSPGILTKATSNYSTATEIKANLNMTFAFMTRFRRSIEKGINDLIYAINVILDVNDVTPVGDYVVSIDWSSAYLEDLTEQYSRLIKAQEIGVVSKAEVRAWLLDEDLDTSEAAVNAISSENSAI